MIRPNTQPVESQTRDRRIKSTFCDATALPPGARDEFVRLAAGADAELMRAVMELLDTDRRASALDAALPLHITAIAATWPDSRSPEVPVGATANFTGETSADADHSTPPPQRIGRYRIIRLLGTGSSGVVYEAEQERPTRRIAVKVLRDASDTAISHRRFAREAEVMALLIHPSIASAYEIDFDPALGRPFIAMELVAGALTITRYAKQHNLSASAKLGLIIRACEAVHYAHTNGVIHRDLKPANLLISHDGRVKIVDFGIARITRPAALAATTADGSLIGTLEYISPEQARGKASTASDQYSLATILYELICGCPPLSISGMDVFAALDSLQHAEPPHPTRHIPSCGRDLAAVILKALGKQPADRYESVAAFAADLSCILRSEPVSARPAGVVKLLYRGARRRPALAVAITAVVLAVLGGWAWSWQTGEREKTVSGQMIAAAADALDTLQFRTGTRAVRQALLDVYMPVIDSLVKKHSDDPRLRRLLARLCSAGGDMALEDGDMPATRQWRTRELAVMRELAGPAPVPDSSNLKLLHALSISIIRSGNLSEQDADFLSARTLYAEALALQEQLALLAPADPSLADDLTWSYRRMGVICDRLEDTPGAARFARKVLEQCQRQIEIEGETPRTLWALHSALQVRAQLERSARDFDASTASYAELLSVGERLLAAAPDDRRFVGAAVSTIANHAARSLDDAPAHEPLRDIQMAETLCARGEKLLDALPPDDSATLDVLTARIMIVGAKAKIAKARGNAASVKALFRQGAELSEAAKSRVMPATAFQAFKKGFDSGVEPLTDTVKNPK